MKKLLLFMMLLCITSLFAQSKQVDKILDNSKNGVSTVYNDSKKAVNTVYNDVKSMSPKVEKTVKSLTEQFKTTSNNLWNILVRQQLVWSICFLILTLTSIFNWWLFYKRNLSKNDYEKLKRNIVAQIPNENYDYKYHNSHKNYPHSYPYVASKCDTHITASLKGTEEFLQTKPVGFEWFKYLHLIICLLLSGFSFWHFNDMLTGFINPEFGALKTIIQVAQTLK